MEKKIDKESHNLKRMLFIFILILLSTSFLRENKILAGNINYVYDNTNRLISTEYDNGTTIIYDYDESGNRIIKEVAAAGCGDSDINHDGDVDGSDLAEYISNSRGIDLVDFAASFGKDDCSN